MKINLNLSEDIFIPKFRPYLYDYSERWQFWMGSAGSGKSYTIAQKLILRCLDEKIRILVCRRYGTTLRNSCFALFKEILGKWGLYPQYVNMRETDMTITFPNGSTIIMVGLDDETKLLSLTDISTVWVEEAYEVEQAKVEQLNLRMRGQAANQQIIMSWNPISKSSWLYPFTVENPPQSSIFIHSTYKDNPFLSSEYVSTLEELYTRNPSKARVFCDGEWGINTDNLVFHNWRIEDFDPIYLSSLGYEHRVGSDLGFIDPTTIVCSLYDKNQKRIYVYDCWYKRGCQLDEVAAQMRKMELGRVKIYMDSAEPRSIEFFRREGFNTVPCIKGRDSVSAGISFLQNLEIIVSPKCQALINELENFVYLEDKHTGKLTEDTDHEYSHAIDGLRYSVSDIYTNKRMKTFDKSVLGL